MVVWYAVAVVGLFRVFDGYKAEGVILTRVGVALFQLQLTPVAREPKLTGAKVGPRSVHTHAAV